MGSTTYEVQIFQLVYIMASLLIIANIYQPSSPPSSLFFEELVIVIVIVLDYCQKHLKSFLFAPSG